MERKKEIVASPKPPINTNVIWEDTINKQLKIYNGATWASASGDGGGSGSGGEGGDGGDEGGEGSTFKYEVLTTTAYAALVSAGTVDSDTMYFCYEASNNG